jgi:glycosyltransferase 2 family protein
MFKKYLKFVLFALGILIIFLLLRKTGLNNFYDVIKGLSIPLLFFAFLSWIANLVSSTFRFKKILDPKIKFIELMKIQLWGFLLNYAAAIQGVGLGAKAGLLKQRKIKISHSLGSIGSEIIYDIISAAFITIVFSLINIKSLSTLAQSINFKLIIVACFVLLIFVSIMIFSRKNHHISEILSKLKNSFNSKKVVTYLSISFAIWALSALKTFFIFKAAEINISYLVVLSTVCVGFIFGLISMIPGGIGVREFIWAHIYSLVGVPINAAISVVVFDRVFSILSLFIIVISLEGFTHLRKKKAKNQLAL